MAREKVSWFLTVAAWVGLQLAPSWLVAEDKIAQHAVDVETIADVALDQEHRLQGHVLDRNGKPQPAVELVAYRGAKLMAQTVADEAGRFSLRLPGGGIYHLHTQGRVTTVRVWTITAAPPRAAQQLALVQGDVLRGQSGMIPFTKVNPWVVAGVVAVAVAVPVVMHNNRTDHGDGS